MASAPRINIGTRLSERAAEMPARVAVVEPGHRDRSGARQYRTMTYRQLDDDSTRIAAGLARIGIGREKRIVLMVRPGVDFVSLTFALFKTGAVTVLIDPGMGRKNLLQCLAEVRPDGFVAIPLIQAIRVVKRRRFSRARLNVTLGRRWFWRGPTVGQLRKQPRGDFQTAETHEDDLAAIIFTTGSTGPPKGVLYRHGNFNSQVDQIQSHYDIAPGGVDVAGFPLFALFNSAMGVTTVIPEMDPTRPAEVDPLNIIEAVDDWQATQSFGSPALWNTVSRYCVAKGIRLKTLERVFMAGAPVPPRLLRQVRNTIAESGEVFTPYGATESLPIASISSRDVLRETAPLTDDGAGTCVGCRFSEIDWRVIRAIDGPLPDITDTDQLAQGEIGELIVRGPVVTTEYITRIDANRLAKIRDANTFWHRMGDVGYLDDQDRFWFCGRMSHRVVTADGVMYPVQCEAIVNRHPGIYRSALVGIGKPGSQAPALILEPWREEWPETDERQEELLDDVFQLAAAHKLTRGIKRRHFLLRSALPVDIRHNAKIFREELAAWAAKTLDE